MPRRRPGRSARRTARSAARRFHDLDVLTVTEQVDVGQDERRGQQPDADEGPGDDGEPRRDGHGGLRSRDNQERSAWPGSAGFASAAGAPPIILSIGPAPERKNRVTSAAAASRKMMLRTVV